MSLFGVFFLLKSFIFSTQAARDALRNMFHLETPDPCVALGKRSQGFDNEEVKAENWEQPMDFGAPNSKLQR